MDIKLTPLALSKIRTLVPPSSGNVLRISVYKGGCAGYEYQLEICLPKENDIRLNFEEITLAVDPESCPFLSGSTIDYKEGLTQGGFRVINPRVKSTCGCGSSFQI
ncbi:Fe-S cluster assembly protein HesB [Methylacidiphilum caldifontis]|uniref:Fe-S cluster assembly protein HesB n=1 Tax=Methylacidiphilum caldifontis TaxID=2795386 RepID=A0A4Y8PFU8_9BACT|nr:Fe-S cluster assembly protein HesB [Methylacidiphilum caldifontis]